MMNDFFTYKVLSSGDGSIEAEIQINPGHDLFRGHFPNFPVVPGVCMVHIIEAVFSYEIKQKLMLSRARSIKFLSLFSPNEVTRVKAAIAYKQESPGTYNVKASIFTGGSTYFKINGHFRER